MYNQEIYEDVANGYYPVMCKVTGECVGTYLFYDVAQKIIDNSNRPDELEIVTDIPLPYLIMTPMSKHINFGEKKVRTFRNNQDAIDYWSYKLDELGIPDEENFESLMGSEVSCAGGIGYDWQFEMSLIIDDNE